MITFIGPTGDLRHDFTGSIRRRTGVEYRGKLRQHQSNEIEGEVWYEGYIRAEHKDHVTADTNLKDRFNRDGLRPVYFHPQSNAEPLRVKLNRIPLPKRNDKNADTLVGPVRAKADVLGATSVSDSWPTFSVDVSLADARS